MVPTSLDVFELIFKFINLYMWLIYTNTMSEAVFYFMFHMVHVIHWKVLFYYKQRFPTSNGRRVRFSNDREILEKSSINRYQCKISISFYVVYVQLLITHIFVLWNIPENIYNAYIIYIWQIFLQNKYRLIYMK